MNQKKTSKSVSSLASDVLKSNSASEIQKSLAGSALSQAQKKHQTSKELESKASDVLKSDKYNNVTKTLAASILSQSNKKR